MILFSWSDEDYCLQWNQRACVKPSPFLLLLKTSAWNSCHFFITSYGELLRSKWLINPGQDLSDLCSFSIQTFKEAPAKIQQVSFPSEAILSDSSNAVSSEPCCRSIRPCSDNVQQDPAVQVAVIESVRFQPDFSGQLSLCVLCASLSF